MILKLWRRTISSTLTNINHKIWYTYTYIHRYTCMYVYINICSFFICIFVYMYIIIYFFNILTYIYLLYTCTYLCTKIHVLIPTFMKLEIYHSKCRKRQLQSKAYSTRWCDWLKEIYTCIMCNINVHGKNI